jgi:hypothetical protein
MHVHSVIDLVPVPASLLDEVVMSFQSAFNDASSDWAQHRAKIALTKQKPLYTAIPRHFPYYWVEWAEDDGVVHPIDQAEAGIDGRSGKNGTVDDDLDTSMPGRGHSFAGDGNGKSSRGGSSSNGFFCFDVLAVALEEDEARWRRTRPPESQAQTSRAVQSFAVATTIEVRPPSPPSLCLCRLLMSPVPAVPLSQQLAGDEQRVRAEDLAIACPPPTRPTSPSTKSGSGDSREASSRHWDSRRPRRGRRRQRRMRRPVTATLPPPSRRGRRRRTACCRPRGR